MKWWRFRRDGRTFSGTSSPIGSPVSWETSSLVSVLGPLQPSDKQFKKKKHKIDWAKKRKRLESDTEVADDGFSPFSVGNSLTLNVDLFHLSLFPLLVLSLLFLSTSTCGYPFSSSRLISFHFCQLEIFGPLWRSKSQIQVDYFNPIHLVFIS